MATSDVNGLNTAADHVCLAEIKDLLKTIDDRAAEGAMIRSKEQWIKTREKPTRCFFQLENKRQSRNAIFERRVNNTSVTSDKNILRDVYNAEPVDLESQDWLLEQLDHFLTVDDQKLCEGELSLAECFKAASQMSSNKSPGSDGLPV